MIVGSGIDIEEVSRIRGAIERHGRRFVERIFTPREVAYAEQAANRYERYTARFAAKEAAMKALGTGWDHGVRWVDVEVVSQPKSRPTSAFPRTRRGSCRVTRLPLDQLIPLPHPPNSPRPSHPRKLASAREPPAGPKILPVLRRAACGQNTEPAPVYES